MLIIVLRNLESLMKTIYRLIVLAAFAVCVGFSVKADVSPFFVQRKAAYRAPQSREWGSVQFLRLTLYNCRKQSWVKWPKRTT